MQLNALSLPLKGTRLIEASAGTGKTFTIAALYLRLVLERDLLPADILVVTFTEAATQELRDRIRQRLSLAAAYFRQQAVDADPFLQDLRSSYPPEQWRNCARRLELAANWMDEAAVYTIHGWCNRMLQQHAFNSGSLFQQQVNSHDGELLTQAIVDYWRSFYYALPSDDQSLLAVYQCFQAPDMLQTAIAKLIQQAGFETQAPTANSIQQLISELNQQRQSQLQALKQPWLQWLAEITDMIDQAVNSKQLPAKNFNVKHRAGWFEKIRVWAQTPEQDSLDIGTGFYNLSPAGLQALTNPGQPVPSHPAFAALSQLPSQLAALPKLRIALIEHAVHWIRQRYGREKQRLAQINFDDMLTRLDDALQGPQAERLAEVIRQQYPMALIDEFQDTDPVQYRIFAKLYPPLAENGLGCFMIGDPKQAIYSFRGADIFTYLKAHQATQGRHYSLATNYRSSTGLVAAVNQLFSNADAQPEGAFLFKQAANNPLPFLPVNAHGRKQVWQLNGTAAAAMNLWCLESAEPVAMGDYEQTMAQATASQIVELLHSANQGTGLVSEQQSRAVQPGDIAILVRNHRQARLIRQALAARQLRSVYLSERDSIYDSEQASDVLIWLQALAAPRDERKVRAALSTATLGWRYQQLQLWVQDESQWEAELERFMGYQQRWLEDGILPTLRQLINDYGLHLQANNANDGERVLTNLLHLAELLQQASAQLEGEQALIRYLAEAIAGKLQSAGDDNIIRLESDANLIKVVTIHKSKGLEYPLVFLPFICGFREVAKRDDFYSYHDQQQNLRIDLNKDDSNWLQSDKERLQEDIRLLYVALTRAQHACWLGLAAVKKGNSKSCMLQKSAIGYLLGWQENTPASALSERLAALSQQCADIKLLAVPEISATVYQADQQPPSLEQPQQATVKVADDWWIASYSALGISEKPLEPETASDANFADEDDAAPVSALIDTQTALHNLPRGAGPGVLIHALLENCGKAGFAASLEQSGLRQHLIAALFKHGAWQDKHTVIDTALQTWLSLPLLPNSRFCLADLQPGEYQVELEFLIGVDEVQGVAVQQIDELICQQTFNAANRPRALAKTINGLLKGFIDCVFVHQNQYYVADYKFNSLGDSLADYGAAQLQAAMLSKRYDLQLVLYVLALHRLLQNRLGKSYDYQRDIGGGLYLFLRGAQHASKGVVLHKPPQQLIEQLDGLFKGEAI